MRSLLTTFSHRAFALVSLGYVNGSLPCTEDISVHCGVFAGGKTGRPTTTSESNFNMVNIIIIQLVMLKSNSIGKVLFRTYLCATVLWLLCRSTCQVSQYPKNWRILLDLLSTWPCWWQLAISDEGDDNRVLLNNVTVVAAYLDFSNLFQLYTVRMSVFIKPQQDKNGGGKDH